MKFKKLLLDESLFEDSDAFSSDDSIKIDRWITAEDVFAPTTNNKTLSGGTYDDDFSSPEYMPEMNSEMSAPEGPKQGSDQGVADLIINSINDEWEAIRFYNSLIATLKHEAVNNPMYDAFVTVVGDIVNEENKHVGQLQEILSRISPNTESIQDGHREGETQLRQFGGLLPVQSWDNINTNSTPTQNHVEETCNISDVDDEM